MSIRPLPVLLLPPSLFRPRGRDSSSAGSGPSSSSVGSRAVSIPPISWEEKGEEEEEREAEREGSPTRPFPPPAVPNA